MTRRLNDATPAEHDAANYYKKLDEKLPDDYWDDERTDVIGQNGNTGEHYLNRTFDETSESIANAQKFIGSLSYSKATVNNAAMDNVSKPDKADKGKTDWSLMPLEALEGACHVLMFGARKYKRDGWRCVDDAERRYYSAAIRHLLQYNGDHSSKDAESGLPHLDHAICCLLFIAAIRDKRELTQEKYYGVTTTKR